MAQLLVSLPTETELCEAETMSVLFPEASQGTGLQFARIWLSRTKVYILLQDREHCTWSHLAQSSPTSAHQLPNHLSEPSHTPLSHGNNNTYVMPIAVRINENKMSKRAHPSTRFSDCSLRC